MENKKENKKIRMISIPENEYRRLKRRDDQLLRIKNHLRIAWESVRKVGEER